MPRDGSSRGADGLPPPRLGLQRRVDPAAVGGVEVDARRDDLVDSVQQRLVENEIGGGELALELLHRAGADDRGGDGRVVAAQAMASWTSGMPASSASCASCSAAS